MTRYAVSFSAGAFTTVYVEAESPSDAREAADEAFDAPTLCAQCQGWGKPDDAPSIEMNDVWEQDESAGGVWEA